MKEIKVYALDVGHGDAVIISLRSGSYIRNILIDGGKPEKGLNEINKKLTELKRLDGIIVTHVDNDHIGGVLTFVQDMNSKLKKDRVKPFFLEEIKNFFVIFNKFDDNVISYRQGKTLQDELITFKKVAKLFGRIDCSLIKSYEIPKAIVLDGEIPIVVQSVSKRSEMTLTYNNTAYITILTPSKDAVIELMNDWCQYDTNNKKGNPTIINKASISFLLEYANKKILMSGDAYIKDIFNNIEFIGRDKISGIDLIKLPHHGSYENNIALNEFIAAYNCRQAFVCADGSYNLPDKKVIEELCCEIACTSELKQSDLKIERKNKYKLY